MYKRKSYLNLFLLDDLLFPCPVYVVLEIRLRALCVLGKHSTGSTRIFWALQMVEDCLISCGGYQSLLGKHEELSLDSQHPWRSWAQWPMAVIPSTWEVQGAAQEPRLCEILLQTDSCGLFWLLLGCVCRSICLQPWSVVLGAPFASL